MPLSSILCFLVHKPIQHVNWFYSSQHSCMFSVQNLQHSLEVFFKFLFVFCFFKTSFWVYLILIFFKFEVAPNAFQLLILSSMFHIYSLILMAQNIFYINYFTFVSFQMRRCILMYWHLEDFTQMFVFSFQ